MSPGIKMLRRRMRLGGRYVFKYLGDEIQNYMRADRSRLRPLDVLCDVTYKCNLRCLTCFRWASKSEAPELSFAQWRQVISNLRREIGIFNMVCGGGEPFLREDIIDIIRFASEQGVVVSVVSNGSLIDKSLAREIVSSGLESLSLSLNSLKPAVHNRTRGTENSFEGVMSAIRNLKKRGVMRLTLSTTVMFENVQDLVELVEFSKAEGLDGISFQPLMEASSLPAFDEEGKATSSSKGRLYHEMVKEVGSYEDVFEKLISLKERGYCINNSSKHLRLMSKYLKSPEDTDSRPLCTMGAKNLFIDPFGNARLCLMMDSVGNLAKTGVETIWNSAVAGKQRGVIRRCRRPCGLLNCNYKELDLTNRIRRILRARN